MINFLQQAARDFVVVGTKADKVPSSKLRHTLEKLAREHGIKNIVPYSAKTGAGRTELWQEIRDHATVPAAPGIAE